MWRWSAAWHAQRLCSVQLLVRGCCSVRLASRLSVCNRDGILLCYFLEVMVRVSLLTWCALVSFLFAMCTSMEARVHPEHQLGYELTHPEWQLYVSIPGVTGNAGYVPWWQLLTIGAAWSTATSLLTS